MTNEWCEQDAEHGKQKLASSDSAGPRLLGAEAALRVVAEQLPKIVPNMLINKRDGKTLPAMTICSKEQPILLRSACYARHHFVGVACMSTMLVCPCKSTLMRLSHCMTCVFFCNKGNGIQ